MSVRTRLAVACLAVAALASPATAEAAYPGSNGKIAFSRDGQIWRMNADGTGPVQLTSAAAPSSEPEWSPDGAMIAYTRGTGANREVRVMNADGSADAQVAGPQTYSPTWSPDGSRIAFVEFYFDPIDVVDIYYVVETKPDGSNGRRITMGAVHPEVSGPLYGPVNDLEWSPRGDEIAFTNNTETYREIYVADVVTGSKQLFTGDPSYAAYEVWGASWSPDGAKLAYIRHDLVNPGLDLHIRNRDGSGDALVAGQHPASVEWSPDGTKLVFSEGDLFSSTVSGAGRTQLTTTPSTEQGPDWQPVVSGPGPGFPRPKGASPLRVSLVPAYAACTAPNRMHGPPLGFPSCSPPSQRSPYLTVGTPDANGAPANMTGLLRLATTNGSGPYDADLAVTVRIDDVRCQSPTLDYPCDPANTHPRPDFAGRLTARMSLRVTDRYNLPSPGGRDAGTVSDTRLDLRIPCAATPDPSTGGTCSLTTTGNAIRPGLVAEGRRLLWELGPVEVLDGGPGGFSDGDGNANTFLKQGIFVP